MTGNLQSQRMACHLRRPRSRSLLASSDPDQIRAEAVPLQACGDLLLGCCALCCDKCSMPATLPHGPKQLFLSC